MRAREKLLGLHSEVTGLRRAADADFMGTTPTARLNLKVSNMEAVLR